MSYSLFHAQKNTQGSIEFVNEAPKDFVAREENEFPTKKKKREIANEKPLSNLERFKLELRKRIANHKSPPPMDFFYDQYRNAAADNYPETDSAEVLIAFNSKLCQQGIFVACSIVNHTISIERMKEFQRKNNNQLQSTDWEEYRKGTPESRAAAALFCLETGHECNDAIQQNQDTEVGELLLSLSQEYCSQKVKGACENYLISIEQKENSRQPASTGDYKEVSEFKAEILKVSSQHCSVDDLGVCDSAIYTRLDDEPAVQSAKATYAAACLDGNEQACVRNARILGEDGDLDAAYSVAANSCDNNQGIGCLSAAAAEYLKSSDLESLRPGLTKFCTLESNQEMNQELCKVVASGAKFDKSILNRNYSASGDWGGEGADLIYAIERIRPRYRP